jgi:hypothetical protein
VSYTGIANGFKLSSMKAIPRVKQQLTQELETIAQIQCEQNPKDFSS